MGFDPRRGHCVAPLALVAAVFLGSAGAAQAQTAATGSQTIRCRDASGRIIVTDKLPPGCVSITRIDSNGTARGAIEPGMSDVELAAKQECIRKNDEIRADDRDKVKRDQALTQKFPTEQKHRDARAKALDDVRKSVAQSEGRIRDLMKERTPLLEEAEFYKGKELPPILKQKLDSNDALLLAQKSLAQQQQGEAVRINENFDKQLVYLKKLWTGGPPAWSPLFDCSAAAIRKDR